MSNFARNLALVLAHSVWYEQQQQVPEGVPPGWARNDTGGSTPDPMAASMGTNAATVLSLPGLIGTINEQYWPSAQNAWGIANTYTPKYNALQFQQAAKYLPQLAGIDAATRQQTALGDLALVQGAGGNTVRAMSELDRLVNPEYYAMLKGGAGVASDLMSGKLSAAEQEAINRAMLSGDVNAGLFNNGSNTNTVQNAMLFGDAARNRQMQGAQLAGSFLPQSRAQIDVASQAMGRPQLNTAQSQFLGVQNPTNPALDLAKAMYGSNTSTTNTQMETRQQQNANSPGNRISPSITL